MESIVKVFGQSEIRFVEHPENKYEFGMVADDLADVLDHSNSRVMTDSVDSEWKGVSNVYTLGGTQAVTVIWEPGIYQLLSKSRKPKAKPFQKWLFEEVLPAIRKTGSYGLTKDASVPKSYAQALLEAGRLALELEKAEAEKALLEEQNEQLAEAVDELFDYSSIIRIAKFNNVSESRFKWQTLKAMSKLLGCEIKKVPCPRFETKNLYDHDVWRACYPNVRLPETTTLVVTR
jgi:prophage antirepressor-like protein